MYTRFLECTNLYSQFLKCTNLYTKFEKIKCTNLYTPAFFLPFFTKILQCMFRLLLKQEFLDTHVKFGHTAKTILWQAHKNLCDLAATIATYFFVCTSHIFNVCIDLCATNTIVCVLSMHYLSTTHYNMVYIVNVNHIIVVQ